MTAERWRNYLKMGDILLIGLLFLLFIGSFFLLRLGRGVGETVLISGDDHPDQYFHLSESQRLEVAGPLGVSRVIIEGGRVWMDDAPCPHQTCRSMGKISRPGEIIVCIPNRIMIRILGESKDDLDAVTM